MLKLATILLIVFTQSSFISSVIHSGPSPFNSTSSDEIFKYLSHSYNSCKIMYNECENAGQNLTLSQHKYAITVAKYRSAYMMDFLIHRYDDEEEHRVSGGPLVDQEKCLQHLSELNERSMEQRRLKFKSKDVNLYRLLDTYGKFPPGFMLGNTFWIGRYEECLNLRVDLFSSTGASMEQVPTRYCWAMLKYRGWLTEADEVIKMGICLPKTCDSQRYKNKFELIHKLMEYNYREIDYNETVLTDVYCLPDEQSPLRAWYLNSGSLIFVTVLSLWLSLVSYCTYKYHKLKVPKYKSQRRAMMIEEDPEGELKFEFYKTLSVTYNLRKLFKTNPMYCLKRYYQDSNSEFRKQSSATCEENGKLGDSNQTPCENLNPQRPILNLDLVEGLKVIGMVNIVSAHALFFTSATLADTRNFKDMWSPIFIWHHIIPAFTVNIFISISGLLSAYMLFKRNQQKPFMSSPVAWVALIIYRYIKLIVAYGFIVAYSKYWAKYLNSGPFWDYATTNLGLRRVCERESWWWTLLMVANFKSAAEHCAAFGWYIAADFQFFALTPIFLLALHKNPKFGKWLILTCCAASMLASSSEYAKTPSEHAIPVSRLDAYGFRSLVIGFMRVYTLPHLRISSWLIGVLIGYYIFDYENRRYSYIEAKVKALNEGKSNPNVTKPELPLVLQKYGGYICLAFVICFASYPYLLKYAALKGLNFTTFNIVFLITYLHFSYAAITGLYILIGSVGFGNRWVNRILSAPFWKPMSRMSICVLVVNLEFIMYTVQGMTHLQRVTNFNLIYIFVIGVCGTYLLSAILFVLVEEPLGRYLQGNLFRLATKLQRPSRSIKNNKIN